jgi:hypothetical protein
MSFKKFYFTEQTLSEVPHLPVSFDIDFEAEKGKMVDKFVKLVQGLEEWQVEDMVKGLSKYKQFTHYLRNELKAIEEFEPDRYKEVMKYIPSSIA